MVKKLLWAIVLLLVAAVAFRQLYMNPELVEAAGDGDMDKVVLLLRLGAGVNSRVQHGRTPLHKASEHGRQEIAQLLLDKGADVNAKDSNGNTPLHLAAWKAHQGVVELLLSKGANVNTLDSKRSTPLHSAVRSNDIDIVRVLLANGASVNVKNRYGWTPFDGADSYDIKRLLVAHKGRSGKWLKKTVLRPPKRSTGGLALRSSKTSKHTGKIDVRVEPAVPWASPVPERADDDTPSIRGKDGRTPLHVAARNGRTKTAEKLIEGGANVNARTVNKKTPLHMAAYGGYGDIVWLLIAAGADVNAKDEENKTPLHASAANGDKDVVEVLLANAADVNALDIDGKTPLDKAVQFQHRKVIPLLRNYGGIRGVNIAKSSVPKSTDGKRKFVRLLLKNGNEFAGTLVQEDAKFITLNVSGAAITFSKKNVKERK